MSEVAFWDGTDWVSLKGDKGDPGEPADTDALDQVYLRLDGGRVVGPVVFCSDPALDGTSDANAAGLVLHPSVNGHILIGDLQDQIESTTAYKVIRIGAAGAFPENSPGDYSVGIGDATKAGTVAVAVGFQASADAPGAVALGHQTLVRGFGGTAVGTNSKAEENGTAIGGGSYAAADNCIAIGSGTTAADPEVAQIGVPDFGMSRLQVGGVEFMSLPTLKALAATSADFAAFKAQIAAL